jgi:outer membrane receptor protein involved in Fe transport
VAPFFAAFVLTAAPQGDAKAQRAPNETVLLPTVTVVGSREELRDILSPGVVSVVYPDDVKGEHKALPDLLDQIPGVFVRRESTSGHYTTASIRGAAPSQVNIYVDGVPMNLANEVAADISTLPISNVERVEVYRGAVPARFSGAPIGGAINIVTKKPTTFAGSISAGKRSLGGEQYAASLNFPLFGGHMLIGLDKDRSTGNFKYTDRSVKYLNGVVYGDGRRPKDDTLHPAYSDVVTEKRERQANSTAKENALFKWENRNFVAKYAQTNLDRMRPAGIVPVLRYFDHWQDLPSATPSVYNPEDSQTLKKREALVGWRDSFGKLDAALNLTWLKNRQHYGNFLEHLDPLTSGHTQSVFWMGGAYSTYITTRKGISGDLAYLFNEGGNFTHQVEFHAAQTNERLDADLSYCQSCVDFLSQFRRKRREFQLQDTLTIAPLGNLQITPIARLENLDGPVIGSIRNPRTGGTGDLGWKTTGSLSFKKTFESGWQVYGSRGNYVRYPNFYELYGNGFGIQGKYDYNRGGVAILQPETGWTTDLGFGWQGRLTEKTRANFRLTAFQRRTKDSIVLFSTPIAATYVNGGPALHRGLELEGGVYFGSRADLQFAVTRQEGHFTGDYSYWGYPATTGWRPESRFPGQRIKVPNIPEIVANARLNLRFFGNALSTFIEATHIGRIYRENDVWENPLTLTNIGGSWLFDRNGPARGARLSFGVNDVFNRGPKQTWGGRYGDLDYTYYTCKTPGGDILLPSAWGDSSNPHYMNCVLAQFDPSWAPGYENIQNREHFNTTPNAQYPREGRVYYVTLAWTF